MPIGNIGTRSVNNYTSLSQNERAESNQEMKEDDWVQDAPIRTQARVEAERNVLAYDAEAAVYGNKYDYALALKNQNDQKRNMALMAQQAKAMKAAGQSANISAASADANSVQYGLQGKEEDLSKVALHTSGSGQKNQNGFYQVGPMQLQPITHANMTAKQRQEFDRIQANRKQRVKDGVYKEETFMDGVKRFVNEATGNIFRDDVWVQDEKGKIYSSEHINMVTGQSRRAGEAKSASTPQKATEPASSGTKSTTAPTSTATSTTSAPATVETETMITESEAAPVSGQPPVTTPSTKEKVETVAEAPKAEQVGVLHVPAERPVDVVNAEYAAQTDTWTKGMLETEETMQKAPEGSMAKVLAEQMAAGHGVDFDNAAKEVFDAYPTEMAKMKPEEFVDFYRTKMVKAPSTMEKAKQNVAGGAGTVGTTPQDTKALGDKLFSQAETFRQKRELAANTKGGQKATGAQQKFMNFYSKRENLDKALKAGVTNFKEMSDYLEGKGDFKPMNAKDKLAVRKNEVLNTMDELVYPKDKETGKTAFNIKNLGELDPRETMKHEREFAKHTEVKDYKKELTSAQEWYDTREAILEVKDKRLKYADPAGALALIGDKWTDEDWSGEKGAEMASRLDTLANKAVANQVKLMSGTAASDKERATILRYMFGDKGVSEAAFLGAIGGYTQLLENKLPGLAQNLYDRNALSSARKVASLYEKNKGKGAISEPKKTTAKSGYTPNQQKIADRIEAGTWTGKTPSWYKGK